MESNKDGFISDIDYKGIAETSVTLFEAVNLWDSLQKSILILILISEKSRKTKKVEKKRRAIWLAVEGANRRARGSVIITEKLLR